MHVLKTKFHNNPNIGLYGFATDSYCLLPKNLSKRLVEEIEEVLDVPVYQITIYNTNLIGIFCAGNEDYLFVPDMISEYELKELEKIKEVEIIQLHTRFTALGNNIAIKDKNCLVNPKIEPEIKEKLEKLGFKVSLLEIAENPTIGSCTVLNHKGCLLHRDATNATKISSFLDLPTNIGTVNFGSPYVRSGLIVNCNGYIVGAETTGPETQRIDETLGFI
ncbi:MAG: translation initiation factor IF-6 [Nanoarchaeota archaeon]